MKLLELPFEAIALHFHAVAAAAAAVGLWRIRAVGSRSDAYSPLSAPSPAPSPETDTEPSRPVRADPAPTQPSRIRPCAAPKERFTAYYGGDEEEEHVGVDGEMTAPLVGAGFGWEVNGDVRRGIFDLGWCITSPYFHHWRIRVGHPIQFYLYWYIAVYLLLESNDYDVPVFWELRLPDSL